MILVKNKDKIQKVYIPKHVFEANQLLYKLHLYGQTTKTEHIITLVDEKNYGDYYFFSLDLANYENQEYKYELTAIKDTYNELTETWETYETCTIATGLLRIGEVEYKTKEYETSTVELYYEEDKNTNKVIYYEG